MLRRKVFGSHVVVSCCFWIKESLPSDRSMELAAFLRLHSGRDPRKSLQRNTMQEYVRVRLTRSVFVSSCWSDCGNSRSGGLLEHCENT